MYFVDTHCHLNLMNTESNMDLIFKNAMDNNIQKILIPGINLESSLEAIKISEKYEIAFAAVGFHPNEANEWDKSSFQALRELTQHPKVKAIGEIGLDFYWNKVNPEIQKQVLLDQLKLSEETGLPIVIHTRNSLPEVMKIVINWKNELSNRDNYGVFHSFEGDINKALIVYENGFYVGIGGPITYKNAKEKQELGKSLPLSSIVLETDSPFLSPHPYRGKTNEPANIKLIAEKISNLSEKPLKLVQQETTKNANRLFAWEH